MTDDAQRTIGKYRIIEKIGQGGFGDVYKAEDSVLGSTVALKLLAPHYMRDPNVVQRFRREARSAARLRHANIVRIYDLAEEQGTLYLAMDYLPGRSLAQILAERGSLPLSEVVSILTQVAGALDYAHQQGLVHRDVKPGNIMVDDAGRVTLMDFGLVKAADNTKWSMMQMTGGSEFTTGGAMMGTPQYMAPEQAEPNAGAAAIASWTDIYSLGIVVYQMVTGRVPFQATTPLAVLRGHMDKEPQPPSELADMPPGVEAAILKALAKQPKSRWPTAGRFAKALATAAREAEDAARREDQLTAAYEQAQQAIAEQRWAQALALCGQIMSLDASFRDVGELFDQANMGMVRQREWEAQQAELAALYDQAMAHMLAREWDETIAALVRIEITSVDYVFRDTVQKLAQAREARERALAGRRERLASLRERVLALVAEALGCLERMQALEPRYQGLKSVVTLLQDARREWAPAVVRDQKEALPPAQWLPLRKRRPRERRDRPFVRVDLEHSWSPLGRPPERAVRTVGWWLLGLSILPGLPVFGFLALAFFATRVNGPTFLPGLSGVLGFGGSIMGIAGGFGMVAGHRWSRRVALASSILFEVGGFATALLIGVELTRFAFTYDAETWLFWRLCATALASMSGGIILAYLLGRESIVHGLGEEVHRPAGVCPIAVPMMLTGLGAIPAVGLLRNRNWGRVATMVFLCMFALTAIIGTTAAAEFPYHGSGWRLAIVIVEATAVVIWCGVAFFYLRLPRVKAWFRKEEEALPAVPKPAEAPSQQEYLPFELETVHVPEGEFIMGSADDDALAYDDEKPQHVVYLESYRIGKHPVTNAQYRAFVEETGCEAPSHWLKGWFTRRVEFPEHLKDHPVTNVSWGDATAYCKWLSRKTGRSYRLPTEAEWEKAARGSDGRRYPWGEDWDAQKANVFEAGLRATTTVGSYPAGASPYGALDMAGNVWEWCQDLYDQDYYAVSPDRNPQGPTYGSKRVLRGGASWYSDERFVRTAKRLKRASVNASNRVGFRCVEGISHDAGDKSAGGASSDGKEVT